MAFDRLAEFLSANRAIALGLVLFWAWVSLSLIARLWIVHRRETTMRKIFWSLMLLVPLAGWLFYGGMFRLCDRSGAESYGENWPGPP